MQLEQLNILTQLDAENAWSKDKKFGQSSRKGALVLLALQALRRT